jgi:hypothetical protein
VSFQSFLVLNFFKVAFQFFLMIEKKIIWTIY